MIRLKAQVSLIGQISNLCGGFVSLIVSDIRRFTQTLLIENDDNVQNFPLQLHLRSRINSHDQFQRSVRGDHYQIIVANLHTIRYKVELFRVLLELRRVWWSTEVMLDRRHMYCLSNSSRFIDCAVAHCAPELYLQEHHKYGIEQYIVCPANRRYL